MTERYFFAHDANKESGPLSLYDSVPVDAFPIGARIAQDALNYPDRAYTTHILIGWKAPKISLNAPDFRDDTRQTVPTVQIKKIEVWSGRQRWQELAFATAQDRKTYLDFCEAEERRKAPLWSDLLSSIGEYE